MKRKYLILGLIVVTLAVVMILVLRFTRNETSGIADGKYEIIDCKEYADAYIKVNDNSIQIFNLDLNSIYRADQIAEMEKISKLEGSDISLTAQEIEELSDLNKMFVDNAFKVDVDNGYKNGTYSYVYKCYCKGNYFGLIFIYNSYEKTITINNHQKVLVFKK